MHLVAATLPEVGPGSAGAAGSVARSMDSLSSCSSGSKPGAWANWHEEKTVAKGRTSRGSPRSGHSSLSSDASLSGKTEADADSAATAASLGSDALEIARLQAEMLNMGLTQAELDEAAMFLILQRRLRHRTHKLGPPGGGSNMTQGIFVDRKGSIKRRRRAGSVRRKKRPRQRPRGLP